MVRDSTIVRFVVIVVVVASSACGRMEPQPPLNDDAGAAQAPPVATASASASASASADAASAPVAVTPIASDSVDAGAIIALPKEPWYSDKAERRDDCVAPLAKAPRPHFPEPFASCDPRAESFTSPPGGAGLHFHYRYFSVALTTERRAKNPGVCCYMIWEFPRHSDPNAP